MMDEPGLLQIIFILSMIKVAKSKILGFIVVLFFLKKHLIQQCHGGCLTRIASRSVTGVCTVNPACFFMVYCNIIDKV
jgi:hypothetical protein